MVFTTENIAVLVAMPSAKAAIAAMVKLGVRRSMRAECLTSFRKSSIANSCERYHKRFQQAREPGGSLFQRQVPRVSLMPNMLPGYLRGETTNAVIACE